MATRDGLQLPLLSSRLVIIRQIITSGDPKAKPCSVARKKDCKCTVAVYHQSEVFSHVTAAQRDRWILINEGIQIVTSLFEI